MRPGDVRIRYRGDQPYMNVYDMQDALTKSVLGGVPENEQYRRYFGRALTPATIEAVLIQASLGYMRDLTDLISETIGIDPHFGSSVGKRFRALAAMQVRVVPASGDGIEPKLATELADVVRQQVRWIRNFKQSVIQLDWGHCNGRSALEKVWAENPGGKVRWRVNTLNWIHPRRLSFGPQREVRVRDGLFQGVGFEAVGLPLCEYPAKFITYTPQLFNEYPEREGFGPRALYWSYFKRFGQRERMQLIEVFGKPWRIAYSEEASVQPDAIERAGEIVDGMGGNATATLPPGVKVDTQLPGEHSGQNHRDLIADANDEISKLVLGTTRTQDAKPGALGSAGDEVGQEEQSSVIAADGWGISEVLTEQLAMDIVLLNFGPEYAAYCPRIEISYELPRNRVVEAEVATKTLELGIPLKEDELYERTGFTKPQPGDRVIQKAAQPAPTVDPSTQPGDPTNDLDGGGSPLGQGGKEGLDDGQNLRGDPDPLAVLRLARLLSGTSPTSRN